MESDKELEELSNRYNELMKEKGYRSNQNAAGTTSPKDIPGAKVRSLEKITATESEKAILHGGTGTKEPEKKKLTKEEVRQRKLDDFGLAEIKYFFVGKDLYYIIAPKDSTIFMLTKEEAFNSNYKNILNEAVKKE